MRDDLCFTPAVELQAQLAAGDVSAVELVDAVLDRIEDVNPSVNAIVSLRADEARAEAETRTARCTGCR